METAPRYLYNAPSADPALCVERRGGGNGERRPEGGEREGEEEEEEEEEDEGQEVGWCDGDKNGSPGFV